MKKLKVSLFLFGICLLLDSSKALSSNSNCHDLFRKIENAGYINNIPIEIIEADMRPGQISAAGFLGPKESLIEVLKTDNEFVMSLGLSHRNLSEPLELALIAYTSQFKNLEMQYNGIKFNVHGRMYMGSQSSPFHDGTMTTIDIVLKNPITGMELKYSGLVPEMIKRYGFYEGRETSYRVEPAAIIEFFNLGR